MRGRKNLTINLIPSTAWYKNLRSELPKGEWDKLRKAQYKTANYVCEICGASGLEQGFKWPVEAHEVWEFDDKEHIQKLISLIALCPLCHMCQHYGRSSAI